MEPAKAKLDRVVITGDLNLNTHKKGRKGGAMVEAFLNNTAALGNTYTPTVETWMSYGLHGVDRTNHRGCLDHVYVAGVNDRSLTVTVVNHWSTDHRPILAIINGARSANWGGLTKLKRRNFKPIKWLKLEAALECTDYPKVFDHPNDVEAIIDLKKERTGHGISDLSYYGLFRPSLLQ
jgi:hypothetical protein